MNWKKTLLFISTAIGTTTLAFHAINKFIFSTSDEHSEEDSSNYYNWKFGNIYYQKTGSGSPLLLIHDLNHYSSSMEWDKVIDTLSREHTVYTIDLLGCGKSGKPAITYTCYLYVQLLTDFIRDIIGEHLRSDWSYSPCLSGKHSHTCESTKPQVKAARKYYKSAYIRNIHL